MLSTKKHDSREVQTDKTRQECASAPLPKDRLPKPARLLEGKRMVALHQLESSIQSASAATLDEERGGHQMDSQIKAALGQRKAKGEIEAGEDQPER